jgi:hypothetical protein
MQVLLAIGDFSRMIYLSVKALRHYHEVGAAGARAGRSGHRLPVLRRVPGADSAGHPPVPGSRDVAGGRQGRPEGS